MAASGLDNIKELLFGIEADLVREVESVGNYVELPVDVARNRTVG